METLRKFQHSLVLLTLFGMTTSVVLGLVVFYVLTEALSIEALYSSIAAALVWLIASALFASKIVLSAMRPVKSMYRALDHLAAAPSDQTPPEAEAHGMSA